MTASATADTCVHCGAPSPPAANWCEACGGDLDAAPVAEKFPCVSCEAPAVEITDDGWCQLCGTKQPAPEDHVVADHGWFAVVSDIGRVHRTNEDAGAVTARETGAALVVCDGVSSTDESQHASRKAARTIAEHMASAPLDTIDAALITAAETAQTDIVSATPDSAGEPPSCTMVTVVAHVDGASAQLNIGWLGDSRAYWIAPGATAQLTRDHSWAMEQIELGQLSEDEIKADKRASSITRWLGADSHDVTPELSSVTVALPGILVVCSDGLWNYAPTDAEMAALVTDGPADESMLDRCERLVAFANERGGHDNITVALASLRPQSRPVDPATSDPATSDPATSDLTTRAPDTDASQTPIIPPSDPTIRSNP